MRITGLATGLDTDSLIKDMMKPHRVRVDKVKGDKALLEYKQEMYRNTIKEGKEFYNKYFTTGSESSLIMSGAWQGVSFDSSSNAVTATGGSNAEAINYKVKVEEIATSTKITIDPESLKDGEKLKIKFGKNNDKVIEIDLKKIDDKGKESVLSTDEIVKEVNNKLKAEGVEVTAKYSEMAGGIVFSADKTGKDVEFNIEMKKADIDIYESIGKKGQGKDAKVSINYGGEKPYIYTGGSNTVTLDGVTFKFNEVTEEEVTLTGKTDVKKTKELIVNFVNDYNKLIGNINKLLNEKKDRAYAPLTDEQKKDMSEDEIKLWNSKVKQGLLKRDSDLDRIARNLKETMRKSLDGLNLEKLGIKPVADYGDKNGTFTIDENKLEEMLKTNIDDVKNMFIGTEKGKEGILTTMKNILHEEFETVSAPLLKKAGYEGSVTAFDNSITKSLEKKNKLIAEMERDLKKKENAYYLQFSRLETQMSKLNSQSSYLMQQLGMGM